MRKAKKQRTQIPLKTSPLFLQIFLALLLAAIVFVISRSFSSHLSFLPFNKAPSSPAIAKEITLIKSTQDLKRQTEYYKSLIKRVGPENAQVELLNSGLPFDGQTHLLNHFVGDFLFKTLGVSGLIHCKDYFLSSCYHGFVIAAVGDKGVAVLDSVMKKCWETSDQTAIQCGHAIGHGFLAYRGYKYMHEALDDCTAMKGKSEKFPAFNCYDGVFMENIFAVHDDGKPSPDRWVNPSDPLYPCDEKLFLGNHEYQKACWMNQPMLMYQMFRGNIKKVADECSKLDYDDDLQATCFNALARQMHTLVRGSARESFRLCGLMPEEWVSPCLISLTAAEVSVGGRVMPFAICNTLSGNDSEKCNEALVGSLRAYVPDKAERSLYCAKILSPSWLKRCNEA